MRQTILTDPPHDIIKSPTKEFPRVYGILMEWPISEGSASLFSCSTGDASLYSTSTFGILGGIGHEMVRTASRRFVHDADRYFEAATPTKDYPYPEPGRVHFFLLTFGGVRMIEADLEALERGVGEYADLYRLGQGVLTQLRLASEKVCPNSQDRICLISKV